MKYQGIARFGLSILVLLLAAGAVRPAGRQSNQQQPPARTLAAGAVSISVDFIALNRDGTPVLDLRPEEVTLKVDSKTRTLRSLARMNVGAGSDMSNQPTSEPPPAPFATNAASDGGRSFVLLIDDATLRVGNEQPLRDAISHFLTGLSSRDRVAVITMPVGGLKLDFTTDRTKVRTIVGGITGQATDRENVTDATIRTQRTLQQLTGWLESIGGGQGPTTAIFFSSSLVGVRGAIQQVQGARATQENIGLGQLRQEDFTHVGEAAAAGHIQFYVVQHDQIIASGQSTGGDTSTRAGLENLTGVTGGPIFSLVGSGGDTALTRVARETASYWLATFDAEANERNGIVHNLSVKVSRDGVSVRVRPSLPIAKPDTSAARPSPTTPHAMMLETRAYREISLRLVGYASRSTDGQVKIIAVAEAPEPGAIIATAEAAIFDDSNHMLKQWTPTNSELGGSRVIAAFSGLPKGNYRLRFAATDTSGHRGTAECDITAELTAAGPMKLSDLVLGLSRETGRDSKGEPIMGFSPRLQFGTEPVALAYLDLYGRIGEQLSVVIEVAQNLNGPAFLQIVPVVDATSDPDRFNVTAAIPIGLLPAGDYVVRAIVGIDEKGAGRAVRTLRKVQ